MQMWEGLTILEETTAVAFNGGHQRRGNSSAPSLKLDLSFTFAPINTASSAVTNTSSINVTQEGESEAVAGPQLGLE
jgi:hypothetical protein